MEWPCCVSLSLADHLERNFFYVSHFDVTEQGAIQKAWPLSVLSVAFSNGPCIFKSLRFEERFRESPFSWRISVDAQLNRRPKAAYFKFLWCSVNAAFGCVHWLYTTVSTQFFLSESFGVNILHFVSSCHICGRAVLSYWGEKFIFL